MKLKFAFLLLSTSFLVSNCNMVTQEDAITFNDTIITEQEKIIHSVEAFNGEESYDLQVSLDLCEALSKQCDESIKVLTELKTVEGGESLKASALTYFNYYKHIAEKDYVEYSNLVCKDDYSDEDYEKAVEIENYINTETEKLEKKIIEEQNNFAKKYKFTLS